jgi:hypothetical protein
MALVAVMAALIVLSAVAVTMAVSIQTEAQSGIADFEALQAEELARSGQEIALFLQTRGLTTSPDFMAGLPFEAVKPGFHYRSRTTVGQIDIYFESDNGRIDPRAAPPELLQNFFTLWTGDAAKARIITESIADWSDPDDDPRPNGAETSFYAGLNVAPRNAPLGAADLPFVRGLSLIDFQPGLATAGSDDIQVRLGIHTYLTEAAGGGPINVNFAPELILRAIPGLSRSQAALLAAARRSGPFEDMNALQAQIGLNSESPAWRFITLSRTAPAVLTVARMNSTRTVRSERRVMYAFTAMNLVSGRLEPNLALGRIEKNVFPDFL